MGIKVVGVLKKIMRRDNGFFSMRVDDEWYSHGKRAPQAQEGDTVSLVAEAKEVNGKTYYNASNVQVTEAAAAVDAPSHTGGKPAAAQKAGSSSSANGKDLYWEKKEERDIGTQVRIQQQAARNAAIEVVNFAVTSGMLPKVSGGKKEAAFDLYLAQIVSVTDKFFAQTNSYTSTPKPVASSDAAPSDEDEKAGDDEFDDVAF